MQISRRIKLRHTIRKETANHVRENCTAKPVRWTVLEEVIGGRLKEFVRGSIEETLNELLEVEAEKLPQAGPRA